MIRRFQALAAVVSAAVPGANPVSVHRVAGATSSRYDTIVVQDNHGNRWVVRAPLDPSAGAQQDNAALLLPHLASRLPFAVPVPVGSARLRDRSRALVYPWLDGYVLAFASLPGGPGLAAHIGECLAHIHNLPPALCDELGVPAYQATDCRERALIDLDRLAATGCIPPHLLHTWEQRLDAVHLWRFAPTVVHGSITERHLLATFADADDAATGRISAVLGWDGVHVADPAVDFAALAATAPAAAVDSVIESYAMHRMVDFDPALPERARLLAELNLAHAYAGAVTSGDRQEKRRLAVALRDVEERYLAEHDPLFTPPTLPSTSESPVLPDPASAALLPDRVRGAQPDPHPDIAPFGDDEDDEDDVPGGLVDPPSAAEAPAEESEEFSAEPTSAPLPPTPCLNFTDDVPSALSAEPPAEVEAQPSTASPGEPDTDALPAIADDGPARDASCEDASPRDVSCEDASTGDVQREDASPHGVGPRDDAAPRDKTPVEGAPRDGTVPDDSAVEIDHSSAAPVTPVAPRSARSSSDTPRAIPVGRVPAIHAPPSRRVIPLGPAASEPVVATPEIGPQILRTVPLDDPMASPETSGQTQTRPDSAKPAAELDSPAAPASEQRELVPSEHITGSVETPEREERRRQRSEHRRRMHARRTTQLDDRSPEAPATP